jgi:hypothetical protein
VAPRPSQRRAPGGRRLLLNRTQIIGGSWPRRPVPAPGGCSVPDPRFSPGRRVVVLPDVGGVAEALLVAAASGWQLHAAYQLDGRVELVLVRG